MTDRNLFETQRDVGPAVVSELRAAGFDDAEEIGRGGFGIVYRCTQAALDRTVAVKVLTADLDENRERFLREQRAMGRLTGHPNIVGVLQVGETESGYPYLVMQYHRRGSLDARIRRVGPLPLEEVLRLGVKMAGALETAHRVGILHRDIKPANILLHRLRRAGVERLRHRPHHRRIQDRHRNLHRLAGVHRARDPQRRSAQPGLRRVRARRHVVLRAHRSCRVRAPQRRAGGRAVPADRHRGGAGPARAAGSPTTSPPSSKTAMSRDPHDRPSPLALGDELQQVQARHGFPVDEMATRHRRRNPIDPVRAGNRFCRCPPHAQQHPAGADQLRRSPRASWPR